jgi:hypothetical protein
MGMLSGNRCRCSRGLKDRWNAQSVLDGELTSSDGALANQVRSRAMSLGSARVSRVGFGVSPKQSLRKRPRWRDAIARHARRVRYPEGIPRRAQSISLRAFFERIGFATQKCERFAGEMEGTGDQDSFLRCPRGG